MTKPLAKSLHTITVLVNVAKMCRNADTSGRVRDWPAYVCEALIALGLEDKPDNYGLADAAIAQLNKGK